MQYLISHPTTTDENNEIKLILMTRILPHFDGNEKWGFNSNSN